MENLLATKPMLPAVGGKCENCRHYYYLRERTRGSFGVSTDYFCDPLNKNTIDNYSKYNMFRCKDQNKNNDCEYYKKKWWMFWL